MHTGINNNYLYTALKIKSFFQRTSGATTGHRSGTAFLVKNKKDETFLITNRHILEYGYKVGGNDVAGFSITKIVLELGTHIWTMEVNDSNIKYPKNHDNDVAGLSIDITKCCSHLVPLPYKIIASNDVFEKGLNVCDFVAFAGFPKDWYDKEMNTPIFRVGTIASDPRANYTYKDKAKGDTVLYEAFSFGGSSGSPVFSFSQPMVNPSTIMDNPTIMKKIGVMLVGVNAGHLEGELHSGLSYFYKATTILEIIDS